MDEQRLRRTSFAIETNLADIDTWKFLLEVQKKGYELHIIYMSTSNIEVLNNRIRERTLLGDHFVKPEIVEERYVASLKLLSHYFGRPDKLQLFDNSANVKLIAEIEKGDILHVVETLPEWVNNYLSDNFQNQVMEKAKISRLANIDEVRKAYAQLKERKLK